jgi:hypothetical protein
MRTWHYCMEMIVTQISCSICKHWNPAADNEYGSEVRANKLGLRKCTAIIMFDESYRWRTGSDRNEDSGLEFKPEFVTMTAFVQDGSSYRADLYTKPEHFCAMHEDHTEVSENT